MNYGSQQVFLEKKKLLSHGWCEGNCDREKEAEGCSAIVSFANEGDKPKGNSLKSYEIGINTGLALKTSER